MINEKLSIEVKKEEVYAQIAKKLESLQETVARKTRLAFYSGAIPDNWLERDNHLLMLAIMESVYKDEGLDFRCLGKKAAKDMKNLHYFI